MNCQAGHLVIVVGSKELRDGAATTKLDTALHVSEFACALSYAASDSENKIASIITFGPPFLSPAFSAFQTHS